MRSRTALVRVGCSGGAFTSGEIALRRASAARATAAAPLLADVPRVWLEPLEPRLLLAATLATVDLDRSFGTNGYTTVPYGSQPIAGVTSSLAAGPGRTIYAVFSPGVYDGTPEDAELGVARFRADDGSLDPSFGRDGKLVLTGSSLTNPAPLLVQPDGKPVLAVRGIGDSLTVIRLNADGTPDATFGTGGRFDLPATTDNNDGSSWNDVPTAWLQPDGKIVVLRSVAATEQVPPDLFMVRLNPDGSPDESLGPDGSAPLSLPSHGVGPGQLADNYVMATRPLPDGGFIAYADDGAVDLTKDGYVDGSNALFQLRFDADSNLVSSRILFGSNYTEFALQPDGGAVFWNADRGRLARLRPDGSADPAFVGMPDPGDGTTPDGGFISPWLQALPDGKVLVMYRYYQATADAPLNEGVQRLNADGTPDLTFAGGQVALGLASNTDATCLELADGSLILGVSIQGVRTNSSAFCLVKIRPDGGTPNTFGPLTEGPFSVDPADGPTLGEITGAGSSTSTGGGSSDPAGGAGSNDGGGNPVTTTTTTTTTSEDVAIDGIPAAFAADAPDTSGLFAGEDKGFFAGPPDSSVFNPDGTRQVFDDSTPL